MSGSKAKTGGKPKKKVAVGKAAQSDLVYQFKITLADTQPPIWRRIQVQDCTLDKLHEFIQTAMGWTNSHLHHFRIGEQLFGDPMLMAQNFEDMEYEDSTTTKLSDIIPEGRRRFRFLYEYDFGDSWQRLEPYRKFARMIEAHWDGIAAYCQEENKVPLGFVEGLNNKIRAIQRRAYGFRDEEYLRLKILTCMLPKW